MDRSVAGKTALVTGGIHAIGCVIAKELRRNGCKVMVVTRGQAGMDEIIAAIRGAGGEAASLIA